MPRPLEDDDGDVACVPAQRARDGAHVVRGALADIHVPCDGRTDAQLVEVGVGGVEQPALLRGGEHGDGVRLALGDEVGALQRVDRDVDDHVVGPPVPTGSPIQSIGASSRSPSPMTMVPRISTSSIVRRMASVAAWSASSFCPRPM